MWGIAALKVERLIGNCGVGWNIEFRLKSPLELLPRSKVRIVVGAVS